MNLEQLNCFIAVVEEGSISAGARRLNLTQPPVSLQLKNLEKRCGVRLLERSIGSRRIHLTEAGKSLYDTAKRMQDLAQSARQDMLNFRLGKKGSLHLGMISSGTGNTFFKGLAYFFQQNPDIPIQLHEGNTYQLLDALHKETLDLAVVRTPFSPPGAGRPGSQPGKLRGRRYPQLVPGSSAGISGPGSACGKAPAGVSAMGSHPPSALRETVPSPVFPLHRR